MILVTGHKGFIGSNLVETLRQLNIPFVGYDEVDGNDIRDEFKLDKFFEEYQVDTVIHLAARAGVRRGESHREEYLSTNVLGTDNILKLSEKHKVNKVILFSSSSVYGKGNGPISLYGMTKAMVEMLPNRYKIPSVITVRPFTVYGENGRKDQVIIKWINQIKDGKEISFYGDGTTNRGYTYVGDLVRGLLLILRDKKVTRATLDLGGSEAVCLKDLLEIFKEEVPNIQVNYLPLPDSDILESKADLTKAYELFGWEPHTDFKTKVKQIIRQNLCEY